MLNLKIDFKRFFPSPKKEISYKMLLILLLGSFFLTATSQDTITYHLDSVLIDAAIKNVDNSAQRFIYDKDLLSADFYKNRRIALREKMPLNSVAVFFANPVRNRSNDVDFEYSQNKNLYYLSGLTESNSMLLVFKDFVILDSIRTNEILFVAPRNIKTEVWNGRKLGKKGAEERLKVNTIFESKLFSEMKIDFTQFEALLCDLPANDIRDNVRDRGDLFSLKKHFNAKTDTLQKQKWNIKLDDIMAALRQIKQPEELTLMMNAIDFTCEAQRELMMNMKAVNSESHAEALVEFVFKKNGAEYPGFPSIIGSGENSCVLHYNTNRRKIKSGDLIVVDIGAEYHGYSADVARTIPVSGTFTKEQQQIYDLVLAAQEAGIKAALAGNKFWEPGKQATLVIREGLKKLGIIEKDWEEKKYFTHGTSHYLGLDVHDVGLYKELESGEVITVEPGIYIPEGSYCDPKWWNIGVRIEDDVLITGTAPEVLSACVVKKIDEIEALMQKESKFFKKTE